MSRPFVALGACACAVSRPTWRLFTGVRAVCGARVPLVVASLFIPPKSFFRASSFFFEETKKINQGARVHCRHRHQQLVQRCNSVVFCGVCRRCFGEGRAPGVRLACPDVHGYRSGRIWLGASLLLVSAG